ncbi:hypothetical protein [Schumannella soli]|uniref:Uncharacterized protein n=1 Tax=Schumannella soli TaxID=2590779 RepID=A0A506XXT7_9MICO|nr:hypothetical protein [Schumannella soli]TPW74230.1 hypothetical protein FJ657_16560 [Schumannella soli]
MRRDRIALISVLAALLLVVLVLAAFFADAARKNQLEHGSGGADGSAVRVSVWRAVTGYTDPIHAYLRQSRGFPIDAATDGLVGGTVSLAELRRAGAGISYGEADAADDATRIPALIAVGGETPTHTCFTVMLEREPVTHALTDWSFDERPCSAPEAKAAGAGSREVGIRAFDG